MLPDSPECKNDDCFLHKRTELRGLLILKLLFSFKAGLLPRFALLLIRVTSLRALRALLKVNDATSKTDREEKIPIPAGDLEFVSFWIVGRAR